MEYSPRHIPTGFSLEGECTASELNVDAAWPTFLENDQCQAWWQKYILGKAAASVQMEVWQCLLEIRVRTGMDINALQSFSENMQHVVAVLDDARMHSAGTAFGQMCKQVTGG